jgi:hypothetical protein
MLPRTSLPNMGKIAIKPGPSLAALKRELAQAAQGNRAGYVTWFKTGKGEYGEGDKFIGVRVPMQRAIARKYHRLGLDEIEKLVESRIHEHRFTGLLILVARYEGGDESTRRRVFSFYKSHTRRQQLGLGRCFGSSYRGGTFGLPVTTGSISPRQIIWVVGATDRDGSDGGVHRQRRTQRYVCYCGAPARRHARSHP